MAPDPTCNRQLRHSCWALFLWALGGAGGLALHAPQREVQVHTQTVVRVMAANLTGAPQKYEPFAIRIFQGLKPDIVAIQEFNYSNNTPAQIRAFIDTAFGTHFQYYRETGAGYDIPNGVVSRYPILQSGTWDDPYLPNRGFAWARLDLPGINDLYVVSVHLKAGGSDATTRSLEATALKNLIQTNFPTGAWIVVAGDCNLQSRSEAALATLKTFLSDTPIPADHNGDPDTNAGRSSPYDVVLPNFNFTTNVVPVVIASQSYNGLVFDSRVFPNLNLVPPVQTADSGMAQHMAVVKDFKIQFFATNLVEVPRPILVLAKTNTLRWQTVPGVTYTVERTANLTNWSIAAQFTAAATNAFFTNLIAEPFQFYRVSF